MIPETKANKRNEEYLETNYEEIKTFMDILEAVSKEIGLPIMRDETWINTHVFPYGKEIIVKRAFLHGALMKIDSVFLDMSFLLLKANWPQSTHLPMQQLRTETTLSCPTPFLSRKPTTLS
nr:MAG: RNA-dependent RNA polymerase [Spider lispi-like virus]